MDNNKDFMESPEMKTMLEQLAKDIDKDIDSRKFAFIGRDGKEYYTKEDLDRANKEYMDMMHPFKGKDGREYRTMEEVRRADKEFLESQMQYPKEKLYYNPEPIPKEELYFNPPMEPINKYPEQDNPHTLR